ncbi:MAG: hypothetical protein KDD01_22740, partial [Phaeodactylibacter sp.]|nr:hypothetical protein [Phaeodactylibacter sp.]
NRVAMVALLSIANRFLGCEKGIIAYGIMEWKHVFPFHYQVLRLDFYTGKRFNRGENSFLNAGP